MFLLKKKKQSVENVFLVVILTTKNEFSCQFYYKSFFCSTIRCFLLNKMKQSVEKCILSCYLTKKMNLVVNYLFLN